MKVKKKIGLGVLSLATVLGSATAMLSNNVSSVSASEQIESFGSFNYYDKGNSLCVINGGSLIWSDGVDTFYSNGVVQYVLDKETSTWIEKTWNGLTDFKGNLIISVGDDYYYINGTLRYVLDKETSTWNSFELLSTKSLYAYNIWTDGINYYYSSGGTQYKIDFENLSYESYSWTYPGSTFAGTYIWTDGENIYYSSNSDQYVLDKETSTWIEKTWNGLTYFTSTSIWTDGENIYYSSNSDQYVLDKETSTWTEVSWNGFNLISGTCIWTDGNVIYHTKDNVTFALNYESDQIYSQEDLENARQEGIDSVDVTSNDKEIYDKAFADGVASVGKIEDDIADNVVDIDIEEEKENGFVSFMKWINKYIFFGLFGD